MDTINYYYLDPYIFREYLMANTLMALGAAAIGLFIAWRFIRTTDADKFAVTQDIYNDAVPIDAIVKGTDT
jgi:hypothetical protein